MKNRKTVNVSYQTLVTLWFAMLSSQVIFVVMVYFIKPELFVFDESRSVFDEMPLVTVVFALIAIVFFILSFVLRGQHMRRAVQDQDAGCVQTGLLLSCALSEIPSLLGLVLAFAFDHPYFYLWIALGALGVLMHFPRKGSLDAATYKPS